MVYTDFVLHPAGNGLQLWSAFKLVYIPRVGVISPLSREFASGGNSFRLGWPLLVPSSSYCLLFVTKSRRFPRELDTVLLEFSPGFKYKFIGVRNRRSTRSNDKITFIRWSTFENYCWYSNNSVKYSRSIKVNIDFSRVWEIIDDTIPRVKFTSSHPYLRMKMTTFILSGDEWQFRERERERKPNLKKKHIENISSCKWDFFDRRVRRSIF